MLKIKKIFVTGGSGFIGQHLLKKLDRLKIKYYCITSNKNYISKNFFYFDLKKIKKIDSKIILNLMKECYCVIHLAGIAKDENKIFKKLWNINYNATVELINLCKIAKVKKFINISSVRATGRVSTRSDETFNTKADGVYGETKRKAEEYVYNFGVKNNIHTVNLRLSNVYGSGSFGYVHKLSKLIEKFSFIKLPQTNNMRSFIHVNDVVDIICKCIKSELSNNQTFIITHKKPVSSSELFNTLLKFYGNNGFRFTIPSTILYFLFYVAKFFNSFNESYFKDFIRFMSTEYYSPNKVKQVMDWEASVDLEMGIKEMRYKT